MALSRMAQGTRRWQQLEVYLCLFLVTLSTACCATAGREELEATDGIGKEKKSGCRSCGMPSTLAPEAERQILNELAKQQILSKLHLKERPNITHPMPRLAVANALRRLHPGRSKLDGLLHTASTDGQGEGQDEQGYEIISFAETDFTNASNARLIFQFTRENAQDIHIVHARLWLYFKTLQTGTSNINARLYLTGPGLADRNMVSERQLDMAWGGWHTFPLTSAIQVFFERNDKTLNLELECEGSYGPMLNVSDAHQPFLVAKARVKDLQHHLAKRSLKCETNSKLCCRKDYYVDFKDIGWHDWIIKPDGYQINYCMGLCPMHIAGAPGMAASFHTTVLNLIKANNINTATNSCCVPTKHRPLSLLYYDKNHNIVKMDIPDMIVESCGCS